MKVTHGEFKGLITLAVALAAVLLIVWLTRRPADSTASHTGPDTHALLTTIDSLTVTTPPDSTANTPTQSHSKGYHNGTTKRTNTSVTKQRKQKSKRTKKAPAADRRSPLDS
jgi:beta-lactamase regulating signal transducer with metallopeptidase domain